MAAAKKSKPVVPTGSINHADRVIIQHPDVVDEPQQVEPKKPAKSTVAPTPSLIQSTATLKPVAPAVVIVPLTPTTPVELPKPAHSEPVQLSASAEVVNTKELVLVPHRPAGFQFAQAFSTVSTRLKALFPRTKRVRHLKRVRSGTWLVGLCGVALLGTQVTLNYKPQIGLYLNAACLLLLGAVALARDDLRKLSISLAILPVVQMVSSTIITPNAFTSATIFYGTLLVLTLCYRYLFTLDEPVAASRIRRKGYLIGVPLMLVLGQGLGLVGYAFLRHYYPYHGVSLPFVAVTCIVFAFAEEMLLRGLVQQQASKATSPLSALVLAAVLYAALAFNHLTVLSIGPAIVSGVVLALVYYVRQNVFLCVVVNAGSKLVYLGLVAGFILR